MKRRKGGGREGRGRNRVLKDLFTRDCFNNQNFFI